MATAVFLITDIEASTRLWVKYPREMPVILERHDELLRSTIMSVNGVVFNHTGDGMAAWFPSAASAVIAAASAQVALGADDWEPAGELRVRMAVHAGDAELLDAGWFGPALNRCARLLGIAHGGQVLVSNAVRALLVEGLPGDLELVELGHYHLRDLATPEHVFQLAGPGLRREFPPLRSSDDIQGNLPAALAPIVGRDREANDLTRLMHESRLVTLVGPGGVGKTRLALEVGDRLRSRFGDGVWLVELASLFDSSALDHALLASLRLQPRSSQSVRDTIVDALADRRALVLFDNCEHLAETSATLVSELLKRCPKLKIMTTSREPLHVAGEHVLVLRPLDPDAALQLLLQRATAVRPAFRLDSSNQTAASALCDQLDRLPLALELAAARLSSMSIQELSQKLTDRFRLLRSARAAAEPRHATLRAVVEWSRSLLPEAERTLFDRLAVFASGFDQTAAHVVCGQDLGDELDVVELLSELVNKSLVQIEDRQGRTRYTLLETVRQYAASQWDETLEFELRTRHARHYAAQAEASLIGMTGPNDSQWVDWLEDELDNLRSAFTWVEQRDDVQSLVSIPADLVMYAQSYPAEVWAWAERAAGAAEADLVPSVHRLYQHLGWARLLMGDASSALAYGERAQEAERIKSLDPDPQTLSLLAIAWFYLGDLDQCIDHIRRTEAEALTIESDFYIVYALFLSVYAYVNANDSYSAAAASERALAISAQSASLRARVFSFMAAGIAAAQDNPLQAQRWFTEAASIAQKVKNWNHYALLAGFIPLMTIDDDPVQALSGLLRSLDVYRSVRSAFGLRNVLRIWLPVFGRLELHRSVAVADGAAPPLTIWPVRVATSIAQARAALGDDEYEREKQRGAQLADEALREEFLSIPALQPRP